MCNSRTLNAFLHELELEFSPLSFLVACIASVWFTDVEETDKYDL